MTKYVGDENEFEYEGKVYVARVGRNNCNGCVGERFGGPCLDMPPCMPSKRKDGKHVIFIQKV